MDGFLIIDKPEGKSSAFVDFVIKKWFKATKVGHVGTLDPFASGVLAIAINAGTKAIPYIKTESKTYEFEISFGKLTDTSDKTGKVIEVSNKIPTVSEIQSVLSQFIGEITQIPSIFSAIKVDGKRAYELARRGEAPNMKPRKVTIYNLELIGKNHFRAEVSPGTYIRTLSEDIAKALGTVGHTSYLRRIKDGKFSVEQSITLENLEKFEDNLDSVLIPLENVLDDIPVIPVSCQDAENLMLGRCIPTAFVGADGQYMASADNGFLEIVKFSDGVINPKKLLRSF
ncbi:MAG: tRNA pseudouridine(55) synthase TruB [Alphaproteobacteria bacterium]|nr:tRNA pseudouridine(55) synthase TruB [Alphaproteobacteria bacterium]